MRLEQTPRPDHALRVSARLITSSTILHLSADELERTVNQEQTENPALEVAEKQVCLFCGTPLHGQACTLCGRLTLQAHTLSQGATTLGQAEQQNTFDTLQAFYDIDNYGFAEADGDDEYDLMASLATDATLAETLLQQLEALIPPDDAPIAEQLVGNLNERGYLEVSLQEIAQILQVPLERVEYVLSQLQTLEPLGIGARDPRECLLIQLQAVSEQEEPHPLAAVLIDRYLDEIGHKQVHEIARQLKVTEQEIRQACTYIRSTLHPFPAHMYRSDTPSARIDRGAAYIHPDVLIRQNGSDFEVELIEDRRYRFGIRTGYPTYVDQPAQMNTDVQRYMYQHRDRARFFIDCIQRRWQTLKRVAEYIVEYQHDFLLKGVRYLRPLTRAEVALHLHLDEGTVSRATANKYALLPNGRLLPLSDFFDGSLAIKDVLRELIQTEDPKHRLSDEELARLLTARKIPLARRTVTKYREEMGIRSSRERGQG